MDFRAQRFKIWGLPTSTIEIQDIVKAWLAISIAFGVLLSHGQILSSQFVVSLLISAFTVGTAFLLHELSHKIVAQKYGYDAEFRSFDSMLLIAIGLSFFGFIFAAPGAVMIRGVYNLGHNGKISLAGPLVNIILALLYLAGMLVFPNLVFQYGLYINSLLAVFNLIPLGMFDGKKVFAWNKAVWGVGFGFSVALFLMQMV